MMDKLYRVVGADGQPLKTGNQPVTVRTYLKSSTAQSVATGRNTDAKYFVDKGYLRPAYPYRVQVTETDWTDL